MNFTKQQIADLCRKYGPSLKLPSYIDGPHLMWAIAGAESSYGANCAPRHEPAYDHGGLYASDPQQAALLAKYHSAAACSFGPWQVLFCNDGIFTPDEMQNDAEKAAQAFVSYFNTFVLRARRASTVQQMAETYNSGHFSANPAPGVLRYAQQVMHYYVVASANMP